VSQAFPPAARLHDDRDYSRVFNRQQKAAGTHVVVLARQRPHPQERGRVAEARLGVMVSTKTAPTAVRRHQLKRWVRELFRRELKPALAGWDVVVLFRRDPPKDGHAALDREITDLARKALSAQPQPDQRRGRRGDRR
jgi:ribonuclease P protein component